MAPRSPVSALLLLLVSLGLVSCETWGGRGRRYPPPPPPAVPSSPGEPLTPEPSLAEPPSIEPASEVAVEATSQATSQATSEADHPLPVSQVPVPIVVEAWAEPRRFPPWGGQVQVLVRVQKRNGDRYAGVEVRLSTSTGTLFSKGGILVTDSQGMTRDRLTADETATITLNAGGTRYRFQIPVAATPP